MDWIIESDKNNGYPYHAELKDIYFEPVKSSPYPSELFILSGKAEFFIKNSFIAAISDSTFQVFGGKYK